MHVASLLLQLKKLLTIGPELRKFLINFIIRVLMLLLRMLYTYTAS